MSTNPEYSYTLKPSSRRITRRDFLRGVGDNAKKLAALSLAGGSLGAAVCAGAIENGRVGRLYDKPVLEKDPNDPTKLREKRQFMFIVPSPDYSGIPYRSEPRQNGHIIGLAANPGEMVQVREWHGKTYPSNSSDGEFIGEDGEEYGRWGKILDLEVNPDKNNLTKKRVAHDGFVAFNFLRPATQAEIDEFVGNRE